MSNATDHSPDDPIIWFDGALVPLSRARVSPIDRGLLVGDGVFETLRAYRGVPFAWRRHYERLVHSASALGLPVPGSDTLHAAMIDVMRANGLEQARVRVTVTGGEGPPGSGRGEVQPVAFIVATPLTPAPATATVVIAPWTRNEHSATAGLKTISYAANVRALAFAHERGADEALFANTAGNLCEATGSNVFVVLGGELLTPPASAGCLAGVTRALVMVAADRAGIACRERDVPMDALGRLDEAFLSSTTREVQAITAIDGRVLPAAPGPVATALATAFRDLVDGDDDP